MSDDAIKEILISNKWLFQNNSFFISIFRWLAWCVVKLFITLADAGAKIYDLSFTFVDFTQYDAVNNFVNSFRPVVISVICISLFAVGVTLIIKHDKMPNLLNRICIVVLVLTSSTYIFSLMNNALVSGKDAIVGNAADSTVYEVTASNIYDLAYIDQQVGLGNLTGDQSSYPSYDSITKEEIDLIDINEVMNYNTDEDLTDDAKDILKKKVVFRKDGDHELEDVYNGFGWNSSDDDDWFNEFYYRYRIDWMPLIMTILSLCLVLILMGYKVFRILFELVVYRLIAVFTSANLSSPQKALKVLDSIKNSYIVALITCVLLRLYSLAATYISSNMNMSGMIKGIFLLFLAFTVIDGPNLVQQLFGIDAGLHSALGSMMALYHAGKGVTDRVTGTVRGGIDAAISHQRQGGMAQDVHEILDTIRNNNGGNNSLNGAGNLNQDESSTDERRMEERSESMNDALNGGFNDTDSQHSGERTGEKDRDENGSFTPGQEMPEQNQNHETGAEPESGLQDSGNPQPDEASLQEDTAEDDLNGPVAENDMDSGPDYDSSESMNTGGENRGSTGSAAESEQELRGSAMDADHSEKDDRNNNGHRDRMVHENPTEYTSDSENRSKKRTVSGSGSLYSESDLSAQNQAQNENAGGGSGKKGKAAYAGTLLSDYEEKRNE